MTSPRSGLAARLIALLALALVVFSFTNASADAEAKGTGGGSVNSALFGGEKMITFAFSAHAGQQGADGSFRFTIQSPNPPVDVHVDVDCLNIFANPTGGLAAWINGAVSRVTPQNNAYGINPGDRLAFYVVDLNEPPDTPADQMNAYREFGSCNATGTFFGFTVSQGNINLRLP